MVKRFCFVIVILILLNPIDVMACSRGVNIYLFYSEQCSYCQEEIKLLNELEDKYDSINIYRYEIFDLDNRNKLRDVLDIYEVNSSGVPFVVIGDTYYMGYSYEGSRLKIIKTIDYYIKYGYVDRVSSVLGRESLDSCYIANNRVSVDEFLDSYGNYRIVGSLYTDDISINQVSLIAGGLGEVNILNIIVLVLISFICIKRCLKYKDKFGLVVGFFVCYFLANILMFVFESNILILGICFLFLVLYIVYKKNYLLGMFIGSCNASLRFLFCYKYVDLFVGILDLNKLSLILTIWQYLIYLFGMFIVLFVLFILIYNLINFLKKSCDLA